jgi:hypothetical protein
LQSPGVCLLSRAASQGGRAQLRVGLCLATAVIVFRSGCIWLLAELPALAPGARYQVGRSVGSGAPGAVQWTATRLFQQSSLDTPGTSEIRRECWSRGRIVSALLAGAQGGCLPSMEPPNPVASTMGRPARAGKPARRFDTARDLRQRVFMKSASSVPPGPLRALPCALLAPPPQLQRKPSTHQPKPKA